MKLIEKLRQGLVKNPLLASIKHTLISPFLGFIYIPLGKKGFILYPRHKVVLYSHCTGVWVLLEVFRDNVYESVSKIEKGDVVVDIGAHVGMFTRKALKEVGEEGLVIAIEPEPKNLELLRKNTKKYKNVRLVNKAVGERTGKTELYISKTSCDHSIKNVNNKKDAKSIEV